MDKITIIILAIIITLSIVGLAFGVYIYFLTPTATMPKSDGQNQQTQQADAPADEQTQEKKQIDPYAEWKPYANEKYGFSFKYPNSWTMSTKNSPTSSIPLISFSSDKFSLKIGSDCCREGEISYEEHSIQLDGQNLKYKLYGYAVNLGGTKIDENNANRFALLTVPISLLKTSKDLNNQGIEIEITFNISYQENAINLFNQILSTFKFTGDVSQNTQRKPRFSGTNCYAKNEDGSDYYFKLSDSFNLDDPTSKITYTNQAKGISFNISYNPNWGNSNCKVEPYTEFIQPWGNILLEFGKPRAWISSEFSLTIKENETADNIINTVKSGGGMPDPNPRKMTIGDKQVVVYEGYGMTTERIYEVIGPKYNYSFGYSEVMQLDEQTTKKLEEIIKTIKFINN